MGTKFLPLISIVTPSFNQVQFIEQTIDSVLSQNYPHVEYCIIDGGSTDGSVEIIKKYNKYLKFWISEPDKGQSNAINKGLKKCTGHVFNWINSDDYFEPNTLAIVAEEFKRNVDIVSGKLRYFGGENEKIEPSIFFDPFKEILSFPKIQQPAVFWKMDVIKSFGGLQNDLHYCMDLEWWMRYLFEFGSNNISFMDISLASLRTHDNCKSKSQKDNFTLEYLKLFTSVVSKKFNLSPIFSDYIFPVDLSEISESYIARFSNTFLCDYVSSNYKTNNFNEVRKTIHFICMEYLPEHQKKIFRNIEFRVKFIPGIFLSLIKGSR